MNREAEIARFLARHGYAGARAAPLAQDASFRRYVRLAGARGPAVLMDAPPPEDVRPFVRVAAHLAGIGLSAPKIIAADETAGLVLEEDLGDDLYSVVVGEGAVSAPPPLEGGGWGKGSVQKWHRDILPLASSPEPPPAGGGGEMPIAPPVASLFDAAIDLLVAMHRATPPLDLPAWDAPAMRDTTIATLLDWWWPAMFGAAAPDAARADFGNALTDLLAPVAAGPHGFTHRDFFAGNLFWLPDRDGIRRVGVIDFQGASIGHPAYDLVSLLQDARRAIPAAIAIRAFERYLAARPELDAAAFRTAYAACAAQRHLRVAGQWVRLARRDNRPAYLAYGPHTWVLLNNALRHRAAAPLAAAMDRWIPPANRANPPDLAA
ncbi:MAG TPA: phosphotransferase [Acetobacteraceae bacterium]|nr:phosphotransferase [Acetobacteraceae bacterium]